MSRCIDSLNIPKAFTDARATPVTCNTVAEVIEQLQQLPADLPVNQESGRGVKLVVYATPRGHELEFEGAR